MENIKHKGYIPTREEEKLNKGNNLLFIFIFSICLIALSSGASAQTDSLETDTVSEDSYTTQGDSPDSTTTEMTWEEMEELWAELDQDEEDEEDIMNLILHSSNVRQHLEQDKQDYRNYYYREKKRFSLWSLLLP